MISRSGSNAAFAWDPLAPATTAYADNGLNQYSSVAGAAQSYDTRGNLTSGGMSYDLHNRLSTGPNGTALTYDPAGRLFSAQNTALAQTRFLYDGAQMIGEYNSANVLQRRFVPGLGLDEPVARYEGAAQYYFMADERGSVLAMSGSVGGLLAGSINAYDEYGQGAASNSGRFQFTGQAYLPEAGLYHFRARAYAPALGRFAQTDPILHAGGMNLYAYVGNDPVNFTDPLGLGDEVTTIMDEIRVWGRRRYGPPISPSSIVGNFDPFGGRGDGWQDVGGPGGGQRVGGGVSESRTLDQCERDALDDYFANEVLEAARIDEGLPFPLLGDNSGITLGTDIYIRRGINSSTIEGIGLLGHEMTHLNENYYGSMTPWTYAWETLTRGSDNRHETFARDMQLEIQEELMASGFEGCHVDPDSDN